MKTIDALLTPRDASLFVLNDALIVMFNFVFSKIH